MKILNLYAGIGGNRKLWGDEHEITAVELDENIASIYADLFPMDTVIVDDAHEYLLKHYSEYDFIWASPPCPTHSKTNYFLNAQGLKRYPDMSLYQEIIFLNHFFNGLWCVENVKGYYDPLVKPQISGRHYFWANFAIPKMESKINMTKICGDSAKGDERRDEMNKLGYDLSKYPKGNKEKILRNCVDPAIGKAILDKACSVYKEKNVEQLKLEL